MSNFATVCTAKLSPTLEIAAYNPTTDLCDKYDMGNYDRIQDLQPHRSEPVEWPDSYKWRFLP